MAGHQLYILKLGELANANPLKGAPDRVPIIAYLIRSSRGHNILVDSGAPRNISMDGGENRFPPTMTFIAEQDDLLAQLSKLGLRPRDIDLLITSHFDWEHCGGHAHFAATNTTVIVQRTHHDHAIDHPERFYSELFAMDGLNYQFVEGDAEIERGIAVLETSGEAIGHQSVFINTAHGPVLLPIDAAPWPSIPQTREFPTWTEDVQQANRSIDKLMNFALEYRAFTIFGHDPDQIASLPASPRAFNR